MSIERTPLESWIAGRLAVSAPAFTREAIGRHQLAAFRETVAWARNHSSYYAQRLAELPCDLPHSLDEVARIPLTCPEDLAQHTPEFLCVPQHQISRVVTLDSSGTSGPRKRIFFTEADQELALDFFAHGVAAMAAPGDRMLIALPGEREGSVGYQLARGISRGGVIPIPHGLSSDPAKTLAHMEDEKATCIIGLPVEMLALARSDAPLAESVFHRLRSIVLCSDHVPESIVNALRQRSMCEVFEHYGSTEMGLGGGVDCKAHNGYHLRESDLYFEIVSPETGEPVPDGEMGEVVFTTLHRQGMPLIRYRTGDLSRLLPGPCACGSILRRLERIKSRVDGFIDLGAGGSIGISALDEVLFAVPGLLDFTASLRSGAPQQLQVTVFAPGIEPAKAKLAVRDGLQALPVIRANVAAGDLRLGVVLSAEPFPITGAKRKIEVHAAQ
jgi:phenylacetate-coenzyme A ligase PaaK-like adenylate-forming protein